MSVTCYLLSTHLHIKPDGSVKPCCRFDTSGDARFSEIAADDVPTLLHTELWGDLRTRLERGERIDGCRRCWQEEATGKLSMRQAHYRAVPDSPELRYLEVAFGNYCNLKCRTCDSITSSSWYEDDVFLAQTMDRVVSRPRVDLDFHWTSEKIETLNRVKFTGGEPMLHPHFKRFIELFSNEHAARTDLMIYTNCSWSPKSLLLDRLRRFRTVKICLSIDGVGAVNDYIRAPSLWVDTQRAARGWLDAEKAGMIKVLWCPTICIYNSYQIADMVDWWTRARTDAGLDTDLSLNAIVSILSDPAYLALATLPQKAKDHVLRTMRTLRGEAVLNKVVQPVTAMLGATSTASIEDFLSFTTKLDARRSESFDAVLPDLSRDIR